MHRAAACLDGEAQEIQQRVALAVLAHSLPERLQAFAGKRGWRDLPLFSDLTGDDSGDDNAIDDQGRDEAALNVFARRDGVLRQFWAGEMGIQTADPGQDPRGAPDLMPLWTVLDNTPEGRARDWRPRLHD